MDFAATSGGLGECMVEVVDGTRRGVDAPGRGPWLPHLSSDDREVEVFGAVALPRTIDRPSGFSQDLEPSNERGDARMIEPERGRPRARQIKDTDLDFLVQFFVRGLGHNEAYFTRVLRELKNRDAPDGYPKYGYVLECDGVIVGAVLQIFAQMPPGSVPAVRCHVTSWHVEPQFRPLAALFFRKALTFPNVTYINVSAPSRTRPIIFMQGFETYSHGQFYSLPLISGLFPRGGGAQILPGDRVPDAAVEPGDCELLSYHAKLGCIALWCVTEERAYPFVFHTRLFRGFFPGAQLIYCRDVGDVARFSGPLALYLTARGIVVLRIDANGPIPGLAGVFRLGTEPRHCRGPAPRLGDLAYTQLVLGPFIQKKDWVK